VVFHDHTDEGADHDYHNSTASFLPVAIDISKHHHEILIGQQLLRCRCLSHGMAFFSVSHGKGQV